jgi:hypothetical protein
LLFSTEHPAGVPLTQALDANISLRLVYCIVSEYCMSRSDVICVRNLFSLAHAQLLRAAHVPSAAFQASSYFPTGSASCAHAAAITSQFRFSQTSGMLSVGKAQGVMSIAFAQAISA